MFAPHSRLHPPAGCTGCLVPDSQPLSTPPGSTRCCTSGPCTTNCLWSLPTISDCFLVLAPFAAYPLSLIPQEAFWLVSTSLLGKVTAAQPGHFQNLFPQPSSLGPYSTRLLPLVTVERSFPLLPQLLQHHPKQLPCSKDCLSLFLSIPYPSSYHIQTFPPSLPVS